MQRQTNSTGKTAVNSGVAWGNAMKLGFPILLEEKSLFQHLVTTQTF